MQMRQSAIRGLVAGVVLAVPVVGLGQEPAGRRQITVTETRMSALRDTDQMVDALVRNDRLALASRTPDRYLPDRVHEGLIQYHEGVPVVGGGVARQRAGGVTVSIFGTLHEGIDVDTTPLVSADDALALVAQQVGVGPATTEPPALVIFPTLRGTYALAWRMPMADRQTYFLDAHSGRIVHEESHVFEQSASVGLGTGIQGQRKKLSTSDSGGQYQAYDRLRPGETVTLDMRHDTERVDFLIDDPEGVWMPSDVASDPDNDWSDTSVVDAHAYAGFTYDYLALQQGWDGMDGRNGRLMSMVNIGRDLANAFFVSPPFGSVSQRNRGGPGRLRGLAGAAGVHAPGDFTPRCGESYTYPEGWSAPDLTGLPFSFECFEGQLLLAAAHGGAVNEAYSDIVGTAVEFMLHEPAEGPPQARDYLSGEDTGGALRRSDDPGSVPLNSRFDVDLRYPDAYSGIDLVSESRALNSNGRDGIGLFERSALSGRWPDRSPGSLPGVSPPAFIGTPPS